MPQARSINGRNNVILVPPVGTGDFITNFSTVENPVSEGGKWDTGLGTGLKWTNPEVTVHGAVASTVPTPNRYDDCIAVLKKSFRVFVPNQFVQTVVYKVSGYTGNGGKHEVEMWVRGGITPNNAIGYECSMGTLTSFGTYAFCTRWDGAENTFTTLIDPANGMGSYTNAPTAIADGDVLRVEIVGNTITYKQNGITIFTVTDTTYTSGNPGMGMWAVDGAIIGNLGFKSLRAGDL